VLKSNEAVISFNAQSNVVVVPSGFRNPIFIFLSNISTLDCDGSAPGEEE
jgi:hypothetical protein